MPISASDLASDTMATAFSYAQAAKGQAATTSATQPTENGKDAVNSVNGEQSPADTNAVKSNDSVDDEPSRNTTLKAQLATKQDAPSAPTEANASNTSAAASVTDSRRDDEDATTEGSARRSEKSVRSASASTRVTDDADPKKGSRKPRKGKTGKESSEDAKKEKATEQEKEQPKIELVEAPLPSVNIWTQRKETQAAKTSVTLPASNGAPNASNPTDAWPNSQESKKKSKAADATEATNGAAGTNKSQRKVGDNESAVRRNGARGSRVTERDGRPTEVPPPVGDVQSWPTPETAVKETIKEEKRKPSDKVERAEVEAQDDAASKGRSKDKWERMDFVPTVQFSTPIPSVRGSRGGRGGARGGRDVTSRGGHGAAAAAAASDKPAGAAAQIKSAASEGRERVRDGNAPARTNSQPPAANKRASMEGSNKEQRKPSAPSSGERNKETQSNATSEQAGPVRERGEGRSDRGRGGYRGRGGHPGNVPMHTQQSSFMGNGNSYGSQGPRQYSSPPLHQNGSFAPSYGNSQSRGGRGGRGQSNGSGAFRGAGGPSSSGRMRQVQTNMSQGSWEYGMPMTPGSYPAFYEQTRHLMIPQLEYYFSVENLLKDEFLRKHMDSQGFVPLDLVLGFTRVRTVADPQTLRSICAECPQLDYVIGDDGVERLRSRTHWQKFVYSKMELRFESARNAGPQYFYPRSLHAMAPYDHGMLGDYPVVSLSAYPNGIENSYVAYPSEVPAGQTNGAVNGSGPDTQLSAQVPEFQPGTSPEQTAEASPAAAHSQLEFKTQPLVNGSAESHAEAVPLTNGNHAQPAEAIES
ncbi:putative HTH La-type RNA-binding protein [Colletotrichum tanaceti]|uniref:Putative HTH La-type RNA-binding protein n=1 Tax=Colletotrichum tanaceti TaxID=1306861 RepID=A0A4U6XV73_9PEZI|nr:putative HTH La-type RNA-binding protein [Colletotrichum tanaceti]KAJ0166798.1 putative HTH La-type RNA-binding protein [Colletotrichum tanaceti]TKW59927.1 putative HTH La-type RNA-binding protein [Colletotrichum tanaceti]